MCMKYANILNKFIIYSIATAVLLAFIIDIIIVFGDLFNNESIVSKAVKVIKTAFNY